MRVVPAKDPSGSLGRMCPVGLRPAVLLLSLDVVACGGHGSAPPPAINPSAVVGTLTDAEKGELCDWGMGRLLGGYGMTVHCGSQTVSTAPSQAACIEGFPSTCMYTVGQYESCIEAASPPCDLLTTSACGIVFDPSCQA